MMRNDEIKLRCKYLLESALGLALGIFRIFPIHRNRILFSAYSGRQFSCNPKYIYQELCRRYPEGLDIVWAFREPERFHLGKYTRVRKVRYQSLRYLYYLMTSAVIVDNVEHWSILRFRPGQRVMNTWHGGGTFKQVGSDRADIGGLEKRHAVEKMGRNSAMVSSSRAFSQGTLEGSYAFRGEILRTGMPRNDLLLAEASIRAKVNATCRRRLGLEFEEKLLLIAPTFRNEGQIPLEELDFEALRQSLVDRFGGSWTILMRGHYYHQQEKREGVLDVSSYPDMQELLVSVQVLLTDYSSSMWDFGLMSKPVFLYAPDLKSYEQERTFYWPPSSWPYPMAEDFVSLCEEIRNFNEEIYQADLKIYYERTGSYETGMASRMIVDDIERYLETEVDSR